jgi:hypothetical protein
MRKTERGQDGGIDTMTNINFLFSQFKNGKREDQKEKTKKKIRQSCPEMSKKYFKINIFLVFSDYFFSKKHFKKQPQLHSQTNPAI